MEATTVPPWFASPSDRILLMGLDLSKATWVVAVAPPTSEPDQPPFEQARSRVEAALGRSVRVICCHEAGYDGVWLHRLLVAHNVENHVLDAASLPVDRRARHRHINRGAGEPEVRWAW